MKNLLLIIFVLAACLGLPVWAQLSDNDVAGISVKTTRIYDSTSLWDYIDGGADLYLEYGFHRVIIQELTSGKSDFLLEIFEMNTPLAAFGVYSVSRFDCFPGSSISLLSDLPVSCMNSHQLSFPVGMSYIRISHDKDSDEDKMAVINIALKISKKIRNYKPAAPEILGYLISDEMRSELKFASGKLGIQNSYPRLSVLFNNIHSFEAFLFPPGKEGSVLAVCTFNNGDDREIFKKNIADFDSLNKEKPVLQKAYTSGPNQVIFFQSTDPGEFAKWDAKISSLLFKKDIKIEE